MLLSGRCAPDRKGAESAGQGHAAVLAAMRRGALTADGLLDRYCALLYAQHQSYESVARITGLDRRTVKRHVVASSEAQKREAGPD